MAGIRKGSSDNLTSPIPHLLNADFLNAAARLTAGQVHYPGRDYYQRDTDTHYRLLAQAKCFLADGVTLVTQAGTWGTLEAHWVAQGGVGAASTATLPVATGQARKVLKSDGTNASYQYQSTNDVVGGVALYDNYALATAARELPFRQFGQVVKVLRDPTPTLNGTYIVGNDNVTLLLNTATASQTISAFPLYAGTPTTWAYPATVQYDALDGLGLQLYQVINTIVAPTVLPIPRSAAGVLDLNWVAVSSTAIAQVAQLTAAQAAGIKGAATALSATNPVITKADIVAPATSLTATTTSTTTASSVSAVNAALLPIQNVLIIGTNVGNGNQAPVSVGGYQANVTGLESASVGGGANTISGNDSATVGGSQLTITGNSNGIVGGGYSGISGTLSGQLGGYGNNNAATQAAIVAGRGLALPVGATNSAIIGGLGFTAPALQETLFAPQLYLFKNGGGISLVSPDGNTRAVLTLSNTGQLLLNGTAIGSTTASGGTAPTITNANFSAA